MSESPCVDLKRKVEVAQREYEEARDQARSAVITEPLEPENMPPELQGSKGNDPGQAEKAARRRLETAEKALMDCSETK